MPAVQALMLTYSGGGGAPDAGNVIHMDSADFQNIAGTASWWSAFSGTAPSIQSGVTDANIRYWQSANGGAAIKNLSAGTFTPMLRYRFRITADVTTGFLRLGNTNPGTEHLDVAYVVGGNFRLLRNVSTQLAISTGGHIIIDHWFAIVIGAFIDNAGNATCYLYDDEGAGKNTLLETLPFSGDTADGSLDCNTFLVSAGEIGSNAQWDDIVFDANGEIYGPLSIEVLSPNGVGNYTELTRGGTDSGANWSQVSEIPAVIGGGDVRSTGSNQRDSYAMANLSIVGTPRCLSLHAIGLLVTGTPTFKLSLRIGGVDYDSATTFTLTSSSVVYSFYWQNNPATGNAWTDADINGLEPGIFCIDTGCRILSLAAQVLVQL